MRLSIDIETFSSADLLSYGVYKYVDAHDFEVLLLAYAYDDGPVGIVDFAKGEELPESLYRDLLDETIVKSAYNAQFERLCLSKHLDTFLPINQWEDTMALAAMCGLPGSLKDVAQVLALEEQKDKSGKALIRYFCTPCTPSRTNGNRTRNLPHHEPEKWELFKDYCKQDVRTERAIYEKLKDYPISSFEKYLYNTDQRINDYGVEIDQTLVSEIVEYHNAYTDELLEQSKEITGLDNPQSVSQLKGWLQDKGTDIESVSKDNVNQILDNYVEDVDVRDALQIRQELSKTSTKKYDKMLGCVTQDGRIHGLLQYYGANRTGRWAGRLVQVQNLPRNKVKDIEKLREIIKSKNTGFLELLYDSVSDVFSQLIRTAFVAKEGHTFVISDYSAIEARIIAWLAQEEWLIDVFKGDGKVYENMASKVYKVPLEEVDSALRQKGKAATLALGYQGGTQALINTGALNMGITEEELPDLVKGYRDANKNIVKLWYSMENSAKATILTKVDSLLYQSENTPFVRFIAADKGLYMELPSGRKLTYFNAGLDEDSRGSKITYYGVDQTSRKWTKQSSYGGKLTENAVQAIARDCLAVALMRLEQAGYNIVFHVHDEVVVEVPKEHAEEAMEDIKAIMAKPIKWLDGITLPAAAFISEFYMKD